MLVARFGASLKLTWCARTNRTSLGDEGRSLDPAGIGAGTVPRLPRRMGGRCCPLGRYRSYLYSPRLDLGAVCAPSGERVVGLEVARARAVRRGFDFLARSA